MILAEEEKAETLVEKCCLKCSKSKPVANFSTAPSKKDGYYAYCRECAREIQRYRYQNNINGHRDKDNKSSTINHYRKKYKLADNVIKQIMKNRVGVCAICKTSAKLVVDHCHTSEKVRGFICGLCNTMLGHAKDNINTLKSAIDYLSESK